MTFTKKQKRDCAVLRNIARQTCVKNLKNMEVAVFALEDNFMDAAKIADAAKIVREWLESSYCKSY